MKTGNVNLLVILKSNSLDRNRDVFWSFLIANQTFLLAKVKRG